MIRCITAAAAVLMLAAPVHAQNTRQELLEQERRDKARQLTPYEPGRVERTLLYVQRTRLIERLQSGSGLYPRIGGLTTGSGFAPGAGYRTHLMQDRGMFKASGAISTKGYKLARVEIEFPRVVQDRLLFGANAEYRYFPQEDYFGIGGNSNAADRSNYLVENTEVMAIVGARPLPWMSAGLGFGWLTVDIGPGTDSLVPSIEQIFDDSTAPGLVDQPDYRHTALFFDADTRDEPNNTRSGGHYRLEFANFKDQDFGRFSFNRFSAEALQAFPIFDKKRVIVARGIVMMTNNEPGNAIPFYMLPTIGGADTVRSFREFRFRDENAILFNLEYRWEAVTALDMAVFIDAGKVTDDYHDLDFRRLKTAVGIGFRVNTYKSVIFRVDIATGGREGTRYFFKFGPVF